MNRADRRKMMRTIPGYKKTVHDAAQKAVDNLENMFKKQWDNDATVNEGNYDYGEDDDDEFNC